MRVLLVEDENPWSAEIMVRIQEVLDGDTIVDAVRTTEKAYELCGNIPTT